MTRKRQQTMFRYWTWLLAFVPLSLCLVQCLPVQERACQSSADCASSEETPHCFEGKCNKRACNPGVQESCFDGPDGRENQGICRPGQRFCDADGQWSACTGQVLPQREICDRLDNDCDGTVDQQEGLNCMCQPGAKQACYAGAEGTLGKGACKEGVQVCESDSLWGQCLGQVVPLPERCNQVDDDCDGAVDENISCSCEAGTIRPCYDGPANTQGLGGCKGGTQTCDGNGKWGACVGQVLPALETCNNLDDDCNGRVDSPEPSCPNGTICQNGACSCPTGQVTCGGLCVNTVSSVAHCGGCNQACKTGQYCNNGTCACPPQQTLCGDTCVRLNQNPSHCGTCGTACAAGQVCSEGVCKACPSNQTLCNGQCCPSPFGCCNNTCVDLTSNGTHCGACGTACPNGRVCCGGECVDLLEDTKHCGACGVACGVGESCCAGTCVVLNTNRNHCGTCRNVCSTGQGCCDGNCREIASDDNHCGACGVACGSGNVCCNGECANLATTSTHCGTCGSSCSGKSPNCCGGACVDVLNSSQHCGKCGNTCQANATCCQGNCVDLQTEFKHCGACGKTCQSGELCCEGACVAANTCPVVQLYKSNSESSVVRLLPTSQGALVGLEIEGTLTLECGSGSNKLTFASPNGIDREIVVVMLNAKGQCIWAEQIGGKGNDFLYDIAIDSQGIISIIGRFGPDSFAAAKKTGLMSGFVSVQEVPGLVQLTSTGGFRTFRALDNTQVKWLRLAVVPNRVFVAGEAGASFTMDGKTSIFKVAAGLGKPAAFVVALDTSSSTAEPKVLWTTEIGDPAMYRKPTAIQVLAASSTLLVSGLVSKTLSSWPKEYISFVEEIDVNVNGASLKRYILAPPTTLIVDRWGVNDLVIDASTTPDPTLHLVGHSQNENSAGLSSDAFMYAFTWKTKVGPSAKPDTLCEVPDADFVRAKLGPNNTPWALGHAFSRLQGGASFLNSTVFVQCVSSTQMSVRLRLEALIPGATTQTPKVLGLDGFLRAPGEVWVGGELLGQSFSPLSRISTLVNNLYVSSGFLLRLDN